jgi:hypothetical protein
MRAVALYFYRARQEHSISALMRFNSRGNLSEESTNFSWINLE